MVAAANAKADKTPLENLMAAMDVVDTIRHQTRLATRELDDAGRRKRLKTRLKELYAAQGIEVPEHVLDEGIRAMEDERFKYQPVTASFASKLAHIYVRRKKWSKPVVVIAVFASIVFSVHFFNEILPERNMRKNLPAQIISILNEIKTIAKNPKILEQADAQANSAQAAIKNEKFHQAQAIQNNMQEIAQQLRTSYRIRVVSRPNESSGVWRIPDVNMDQRNYYLIVEAVADDNKIIELAILNEETGKTKTVRKWGLRVNENTFFKVVADKNDDGIIQNNILGRKPPGFLKPEFSVPTAGGTITEW